MVLILESRTHLDLGDLPNLLAAELGVMTVRLERAIRSLDGVARVHVNRWGDGSAHLHMWFLARPYGRLQLRGTFLSLWDSILPPISEAQWRENLALVAAWLAEFGGRPLAEPPRIQWQAPSSLLAQSAAADAAAADAAAAAAVASVIEAAEEIPEPAIDSGAEPTDGETASSADPIAVDANDSSVAVTDPTGQPTRSAPNVASGASAGPPSAVFGTVGRPTNGPAVLRSTADDTADATGAGTVDEIGPDNADEAAAGTTNEAARKAIPDTGTPAAAAAQTNGLGAPGVGPTR
ncbi:hypothetical protein [Micromonospora sp. NPDC005413]|uniref:hypothetical protein n=1 Tax=Micromonospora sp. NPDC005413 TaxID=3154563 RepID=UPI0033ABFD30